MVRALLQGKSDSLTIQALEQIQKGLQRLPVILPVVHNTQEKLSLQSKGIHANWPLVVIAEMTVLSAVRTVLRLE